MQYSLNILPKLSAMLTYSGPCILRPPIQPEKCRLILKVVLIWRDISIEIIKLVAGLKIEEGRLKMEGSTILGTTVGMKISTQDAEV